MESFLGSLLTRTEYGVLKCLPELQRHDAVEDWVDGGAHIIENTRNIEENIREDYKFFGRHVHNYKALSMKWSPADEEPHNNSNYNGNRKVRRLISI